MFGGNMQQMMKQAQMMQGQMMKAIEELDATEIEISSGGGMVKVVMLGNKTLKSITIDKNAVDPDDVEMLEDLIMAAINEATTRAEEMRKEKLGKFGGAGGLF